MLTIILQWLYLLAMTYCIGFACFLAVERVFSYRVERVEAWLVAGLVFLTVYAQFFSLFHGVGLFANGILLLSAAAIAVVFRRRLFRALGEHWRGCSSGRKLVLFFLFFLWAYCTSRGYMVPDTDLYHAQSIRWIEDYGVVKGLGNLHERFAYNSSLFALYALFSMKFLTGGFSLHTINGFFAFVLCLPVLDVTKAWKRKRLCLSDFARLGAAYYLTTVCDEVIAPSSDYAVMFMIFYVIIDWLRLLEEKEENIAPYSLLCVAGVYTLTLKLSAGLILLLLLKPAVSLLRNKKWKDIVCYLCLGLLVALPWMARSVYISGYLIYPMESLDLFSVDWKMDADKIPIDVAQIQTWGRALYNVTLADVPVTGWFGNWFRTTLSTTEKALVAADLLFLAVFVLLSAVTVIQRRWSRLDRLLVLGTVSCSYVYWQLSAPLMRYGYAYVLLLAALTAGWFVTALKRDGLVRLGILLIAVYKLVWLGRYAASCAAIPAYVWQENYGVYESETFEKGGVTFYQAVDGGLVGYDLFPGCPVYPAMELRGEGLEDGFWNPYK